MSLDELYRELILDHYRSPRNRGELEDASAEAEMQNPLCGDEMHITVEVRDGLVADVRFQGRGCSISVASASMMTEAVRGKPVPEALATIAAFKRMMRGEGSAEDLGDVEALQGVARFPVRIKCATLAWNTLQKALEGQEPEE
jgi:nitrogen fixation NifU-like protein